ncbi:MAG TPA: LapA family protein, partial [Candidatus Acidoferrum sp.]|nr:LapA family protein [Candidatus Acidoferrum sp.]
MNAKLILSVVVAGLVVLFVLQNVGAVEIRFLFWSFSASGSLLFLIIFFLGAVIGWSWHSLCTLGWKKTRNRP